METDDLAWMRRGAHAAFVERFIARSPVYVILIFVTSICVLYNMDTGDVSIVDHFGVSAIIAGYIVYVLCPVLYHILFIRYFVSRSQKYKRLFFKDNLKYSRKFLREFKEYRCDDKNDESIEKRNDIRSMMEYFHYEKERSLQFITLEELESVV